jgi:hypothetical protein
MTGNGDTGERIIAGWGEGSDGRTGTEMQHLQVLRARAHLA